ncbi:hypothetical protein VIGAN_03068400 [Vigna angularis var. angularis]|uniref:HMA domain-containing protein n=1 Tax=Vigna angularis var. angularis TaxID=157739 RepID=A0A0S3RK90_PHAAN|nr:hypothetical protein VIGAN_03068400 [Vigna angularis var. angularis]
MKKIVIKMHVASEKCRKKAMVIAAECQGVESIEIDTECSEIVVTGDEVDPFCLTKQMKKKFRHATLIHVENIKGGVEEDGQEEEDETIPEKIYPPSCAICSTSIIQPAFTFYEYPNNCSIL